MADSFTLTLIQTELHWEQKDANFARFDKLIKEAASSDLILLPEMFSTGFSMKPQELADEPEGKTLSWLQSKARDHETAISGSVIIRDNGKYYNRLYFVFPDGSYRVYDKKHLFTLAGEHKVYSGGNEHLVLQHKGWKIMPLVCYDLRFPVWCRNTQEVDLQFFVANWPHRRSLAWKTLLRARAIENMCFVAGLNRVGDDGNGVAHSGDSAVYDELGEEILACPPFKKSLKTITLSKERMHESRDRFQFLADRDSFKLTD